MLEYRTYDSVKDKHEQMPLRNVTPFGIWLLSWWYRFLPAYSDACSCRVYPAAWRARLIWRLRTFSFANDADYWQFVGMHNRVGFWAAYRRYRRPLLKSTTVPYNSYTYPTTDWPQLGVWVDGECNWPTALIVVWVLLPDGREITWGPVPAPMASRLSYKRWQLAGWDARGASRLKGKISNALTL